MGPYPLSLTRMAVKTVATHRGIEAQSQFMGGSRFVSGRQNKPGLTKVAVRERIFDSDAIDSYVPFAKNFYLGESPDSTYFDATETWDRGLGSLNTSADAQGDLLHAAGLLVVNNMRLKFARYRVKPPIDGDSTFASFNSHWDENSSEEFALPERQQFDGPTLLAGELLHKAGLLENDKLKRDHLFDMAQSLYQKADRKNGFI